MKILFFIDCLGPGGKERRLTELMKAIKLNTTIEFELVVMHPDIHYEIVYNLGVPIHQLLRSTKKDFSIFKQLYNLCKSIKPDLIHCWDSMTAVYSAPICKILKIKLVNGMVTDTIVAKKIKSKSWLRARLTFPFSDIIIGNSLAGLATYGAKKSKSICIYNGFNFERLSDLKPLDQMREDIFGNNAENSFIVGMVAAFEPRKDYNTLLNAAILLLDENKFKINFLLIGEGSTLESLKERVSDKYAKYIYILNRRSDVESLIRIFDVCVLLTNTKVHGEGISNSILEYMAAGKPVIATTGGGTNELISDNYNGFLIPEGDESLLADLILKLYKDKEMIEKLGKNGRKTIQEKFSIELMTSSFISVYKSVLKK